MASRAGASKAGARAAKAPAKRAAATKAPAKKAAPRRASAASLPPVVYAQASPHSIGGLSMFDAVQPITSANAVAFMSEERLLRDAATRLQRAGFAVLQVSATSINIAGPASLYNDVFGARLYTEDRPVIKSGAREDVATFVDSPTSDMPGLLATGGTPFGDVLEGVAIEVPRYWMQPSALAPNRAYWYLDVPGDVSLGIDADRAHRAGITGKNVQVVMVDSGHYAHPYFTKRGYRVAPVVLAPGTTDATTDDVGHGTGESANAFAVAPDINFTMVKTNFVNTTAAFNAGVGLSPHIISCSWGSSIQFGPLGAADQALAAAIAAAVASGIVVVFSAGNGHWGFPGQHPDVISAGGVYMAQDESMQASNYASGFASNIYPGRNCPDASGLVGLLPGAAYIMLPVQPGDQLDSTRAGGTFPGTTANPRDETAPNDGWGVFSGTSAAAPQLAGVCALIKQVCAKLTPAEIRDILKATARDVTTGVNAMGNSAGPGYDLATGAGLVDAYKAVQSAQLKCITIKPPIITVQPPVIQPPIVVGPPVINPPTVLPPTIGPPVINPPTILPPVINPPTVLPPTIGPPVINPPTILPPVISPPIINPPVIKPPIVVGPPIVLPPIVRPPVVGPPVINPPTIGPASSPPDLVTVVAQLLGAGYSQDDVRAYLTAAQAQSTGITEDQAELLQQAILDGEDLGL
jgi:hypothetical protein